VSSWTSEKVCGILCFPRFNCSKSAKTNIATAVGVHLK
jgi:hypothetical protein